MGFISDRAATERRRQSLRRYLSKNVLTDGALVCKELTECKKSHDGAGHGEMIGRKLKI